MKPELAARSALLVSLAGVVALVTISLFLGGFGDVFGGIDDAALFVMTLALAPVMGMFYESGGRTPLRPAQASLISAVLAVLVWCVVQALMIRGVVTFDYEAPATGAFAVEALAVIVIGLWLAGADLLAAAWLPNPIRWLGVVAGVGTVVYAIGLLKGGVNDPLVIVGGIAYQILLPAWAFLLWRLWRPRQSH